MNSQELTLVYDRLVQAQKSLPLYKLDKHPKLLRIHGALIRHIAVVIPMIAKAQKKEIKENGIKNIMLLVIFCQVLGGVINLNFPISIPVCISIDNKFFKVVANDFFTKEVWNLFQAIWQVFV